MKFLDKYRWAYVGAVEGISKNVDEKGNEIPGQQCNTYWILEQRGDGKRRFSLIGRKGTSPYSISQEAHVMAWLKGGPLPNLQEEFRPEPNRGQLLLFQGGKS